MFFPHGKSRDQVLYCACDKSVLVRFFRRNVTAPVGTAELTSALQRSSKRRRGEVGPTTKQATTNYSLSWTRTTNRRLPHFGSSDWNSWNKSTSCLSYGTEHKWNLIVQMRIIYPRYDLDSITHARCDNRDTANTVKPLRRRTCSKLQQR
jgi:hypothetical protein